MCVPREPVSAFTLGATTAVSLVCVRAIGDAGAGAPQFECRILAEAPRSSGSTAMIGSAVRSSSSLSRGFVGMFLAVPPELLHGASGETPILTVRIN